MEEQGTVSAERRGNKNRTHLFWGLGATCMPRYIIPDRCWDEGRVWERGSFRREVEAIGRMFREAGAGEKACGI